jgi:hypothetical protein
MLDGDARLTEPDFGEQRRAARLDDVRAFAVCD